MKKLLLILSLCGILLSATGCAKVERIYPATYIYRNDCTADIIMKSYSPWYYSGEYGTIEKVFEIKSGDKISISGLNVSRGFPRPLIWDYEISIGKDSTIVELGNKRIIHRSWLSDPLYEREKYELISSKKGNYLYQWTFTNEDFADAEDIE